jgi:hypothetical protein
VSGWSALKRDRVETAFYQYLKKCVVNSKDSGQISLGENLYQGQIDVITAIFDAMENDIHKIFILKSRQLGISTIIRALTIFLLGIHKGLKGAIVFDTDNNRSESRAEVETMINDLPETLKFPGISSNNRAGLTLANDSKVLFMSAGVKKSKSSGTLGRSVGLTIAHCSELCSWDNDDGLEAFEQSLSEIHPDRLYIYESTARGFNRWNTMWEDARKDPMHCKCIFLGWWSKGTQSIQRDDIDWSLYGEDPPDDKERLRIKEVKERYEFDVTQEQLAWYRRKMDPTRGQIDSDASDAARYEQNTLRMQEQPWTEDEAFQQTGAVFFANKDLTDLTNNYASHKYKPYMFLAGEEFSHMQIHRADNPRSCELKVWEEPDPEGVYVFGVDPAYGENENNCNSAIQILRCYADGVDQVAEYAWPLQTTRHLAWTLAALLGWYGASPRAECRYILELNGPGTAVFNEIKALKFYIENATFIRRPLEDIGLQDIFKNVKTYIFSRPDSMGAGYNYHWLTNTRLKVTIMEQLRDIASNGKMRVRSHDLIKELRSIRREGDSIGADSSMRDDRAVAMALANYYWATKIRQGLVGARRTRAAEESRQRLSIVDQVGLFQQNMLENFFSGKAAARRTQAIQATRNAWRNGMGRRY